MLGALAAIRSTVRHKFGGSCTGLRHNTVIRQPDRRERFDVVTEGSVNAGRLLDKARTVQLNREKWMPNELSVIDLSDCDQISASPFDYGDLPTSDIVALEHHAQTILENANRARKTAIEMRVANRAGAGCGQCETCPAWKRHLPQMV